MASLDNVKKRCVFVELVDGRANAPYEIILEESSTVQSDLQQIANRMVAKNKELASVFESGYCSFERESEFRVSKWVKISDNSPIKHLSEVRCVVKKFPQFTFEGVAVPFMHESQSSQDFDNILHSTPILHRNSSRASFQDYTSHSGNLGNENATTSKLLNTISPFDSGLDCDDVSSDNLVIASTSQQLSSVALDSEVGPDHVPSDSDEEVNAQEIYSQIFPLSERNDKGYRRLDTKKYKVPSFFGTALTEKMKHAKTLLSENEYKAVYRTLADSIEIQTLHPHPDSIRFVVDTTLARFPNLIIDKKDQTATHAIFYSKLKRIMEYKRRVAKQQFNSKGGRVKNVSSFDNQGPAAKKTRREVENDAEHATVAVIDVASYSENVKKLLQVCSTFGSPQSIKALYLLTFEGRRREILANKFANVAEILKTACPVLNQTAYLQYEFELMKGKGICNTFMKNWTTMVPRIVQLAKTKNTVEINKVLGLYPKNELEESFDISACAALEVLPYLIPVRKKKGVIPSHFLYYPQEDSVSLEAVLKEMVNRPPFIIQIEDSFHVIVDNQVLVTSNSVSEALLNVFSSYYVFYIAYSKQVLKSLLFLQSEVFCFKDDASINCPGLPLFVNNLNAVKLA